MGLSEIYVRVVYPLRYLWPLEAAAMQDENILWNAWMKPQRTPPWNKHGNLSSGSCQP
jgi:hypothetical protein